MLLSILGIRKVFFSLCSAWWPITIMAELQRQRQKILSSRLACATLHTLTEKLKPNQNSRSSNSNKLTDCVLRDLITGSFSPKAQCKLHVNCGNGHSRYINTERYCWNYCFSWISPILVAKLRSGSIRTRRNGLCFSSGTWAHCKGVDYIAMPSGDTTENQIFTTPRDVNESCGLFVTTVLPASLTLLDD